MFSAFSLLFVIWRVWLFVLLISFWMYYKWILKIRSDLFCSDQGRRISKLFTTTHVSKWNLNSSHSIFLFIIDSFKYENIHIQTWQRPKIVLYSKQSLFLMPFSIIIIIVLYYNCYYNITHIFFRIHTILNLCFTTHLYSCEYKLSISSFLFKCVRHCT